VSVNSILDIDYEWWMTPEQKAAARAHEKAAKAAGAKFDRRIKKAIEEAAPFMREWGDGNGGEMMRRIDEQMYASGAIRSRSRGDVYQKAKISRTLAKAVFERDAYRCVMCSSHVDLCCDHIISERDGGPTTLENLQTLCRPCNSTKGKKSFSVLKRNAA
jgi:hypothetical protein